MHHINSKIACKSDCKDCVCLQLGEKKFPQTNATFDEYEKYMQRKINVEIIYV